MEREKEALKEWARANGQDGFDLDQQTGQSYWIKRDEQTYLREWDFENVSEVQALMDQLEINKHSSKVFEEIRKTVLVSIMKGRQENLETGVGNDAKDVSLPEYIYVF